MKNIIVDYEIGGQPYRVKLRVSNENFHSLVGLSGFKTHFDNSMEIHLNTWAMRLSKWYTPTR